MPSFIVKFNSDADLESFKKSIECPRYRNLKVHYFHNPPDAVIKGVDSGTVAELKQVAGSKARFIADYAHDMF